MISSWTTASTPFEVTPPLCPNRVIDHRLKISTYVNWSDIFTGRLGRATFFSWGILASIPAHFTAHTTPATRRLHRWKNSQTWHVPYVKKLPLCSNQRCIACISLTFDENAFYVSCSHLQRGGREPWLRLGERAWQHHGFGPIFDLALHHTMTIFRVEGRSSIHCHLVFPSLSMDAERREWDVFIALLIQFLKYH